MKTTPTGDVIRYLCALAGHAADPSDDQLLRGYLEQRDEEAFAALVRRHGGMVLALCRRLLRREADAEDAFQATFLVLARHASTVRSGGSLAAWLHRVARRVSLRVRAAVARHSLPGLTDANLAVLAPDPSWSEVRAVLDEELDRLPERLRGPLVLCYLEGLTRDEAAARLGCPLGTLKGRLERGREILRQRLIRRGLALSAALAVIALEQTAVPQSLAAAVGTASASRRVLDLAAGFGPPSRLAVRAVLAAVLVVGAVLAGAAFLPSPQPPPPAPQARPNDKPPAQEEMKPRLDALGDPLPSGAVARLGSVRLYHGGVGIARVVLSPDAKFVVSVGGDGENKLWDAVTGKAVPLADADRRAFVFAAGGKLLATGPKPTDTQIHDLLTGKEVTGDGIDLAAERKKAADRQEVPSPDGKTVATMDSFGKVRLLDATSRKELPPPEGIGNGHAWSVAFSPDGKRLAASFSDDAPEVHVWDLATRKVIARLEARDFRVTGTSFSADGKVLAGIDGPGVTLWDVGTGKLLHDFGHGNQVFSVAFTADGRSLITATSYQDKHVRVWDALTGKEQGRWADSAGGLTGLALLPDGQSAVAAAWRKLKVVDVKTGKETALLKKGDDPIWGLALSDNGKRLAVTQGSVCLWDMTTGKPIRSFGAADPGPMRVAISPDGKYVAADYSSSNKVRLFDAATGDEARVFVGQGKLLGHPSFSADGTLLAAGDSDGTVRVWEAATGRERLVLGEPAKAGKESQSGQVQFSPDGRMIAAASYWDKVIRVWEVASGRERLRFDGHLAGVLPVAFSPDGSLLASGSADRTVLVWDVSGRHTHPRAAEPSEDELLRWWDTLADADAARAFAAVRALAAARSSVAFLKERLSPAVVDAKAVERLLTDLDSDDFTTREKASKDVLGLGDAAEPLLRKALDGNLSTEARRRVEQTLTRLDPLNSPAILRGPRAVEALEGVGTPEAREVLKRLAGGDTAARLTREAKAALARLSKPDVTP